MSWYAVCSMGELTERDDDIIRVPESILKSISMKCGNAFIENFGKTIIAGLP